jgi:hypothetical protein
MKIIRPLLVILIILGLNGASVLSEVFIWQSSILYTELYEALLEDFKLIDIPGIIFENFNLYSLLGVVLFFTIITIFLINSSSQFIYQILQEIIFLNNSILSYNLKTRSPPLNN